MNNHRSTPEWEAYYQEYNRLAHQYGHYGFWEGISSQLPLTDAQAKYLHSLAQKAVAADTARWRANQARYTKVS